MNQLRRIIHLHGQIKTEFDGNLSTVTPPEGTQMLADIFHMVGSDHYDMDQLKSDLDALTKAEIHHLGHGIQLMMVAVAMLLELVKKAHGDVPGIELRPLEQFEADMGMKPPEKPPASFWN